MPQTGTCTSILFVFSMLYKYGFRQFIERKRNPEIAESLYSDLGELKSEDLVSFAYTSYVLTLQPSNSLVALHWVSRVTHFIDIR